MDTNVIVQYIIFNQLSKRKEKLQKGTPSYERYEMAHKLIKKVIDFDNEKVLFFISLLVRAEFYSALFEEYKCREMYKGGIPLGFWHITKNKVKLEDEHRNEINIAIAEFENQNVSEAKNKIWSSWDVYHYPLISEFASRYNIRSHDSILISTAMFNHCDYFVTLDKRLIDTFKPDVITFGGRKIKLISPDIACEIINKI